jgi:hypothetical protein
MAQISTRRRVAGLVAAALTAPPLTTFLFLVVGSPDWAGSGLLLLALPLSLIFGVLGALIFLAPAMLAAESMFGNRAAFLVAGAAAGAAHSGAGGLSALAGAPFSAVEWVGGFLLASLAASEPMAFPWLLLSAMLGGCAAGRVYWGIVRYALED